MHKRIHTIKILHGRHLTLCVAFACVISLLTGCNKSADSPELLEIYDYVSNDPQKALGALDSIDYRSLSDANRHFYDFLSIKAKDKAYIDHTSDSLILDVIDYYSSGNDNNLYAEALYYGGRVYSDLGDYPTSLRYFQKALDRVSSDTDASELRACIVSQFGRLFNSLRIYNEAAYYIQESINIDKQLNDTINTVYDLQLLANTYLRGKEYDLSEKNLKEAIQLSENLSEDHTATSKMYLAKIKYDQGNIDSALYFIRNTPNLVEQKFVRNSALGYAALIYRDAGIMDTAYMYAHEIINSPNDGPLELAYHIILSPELRDHIPQDTLDDYLSSYVSILENYYEKDKIQFAINQQNLYNYNIHEREKIKVLKANEKLKYWIAASVLLLFIMAIIILYLKNRSKARIIELHEAIENIKMLNSRLEEKARAKDAIESTTLTGNSSINKEEALREKLREEILALYEKTKNNVQISHELLQSEVYQKLNEKLSKGEIIADDDSFWTELEDTILKVSPNFVYNLNLLSMGRLTVPELHTTFLIKCGLRPSQMQILLGRSQGAIVSRRESICKKVLNQKMKVTVIDAIIRML